MACGLVAERRGEEAGDLLRALQWPHWSARGSSGSSGSAWREGACCSMLASPTTSVSGCTRRLERSAMRWGAHGVVSALAL